LSEQLINTSIYFRAYTNKQAHAIKKLIQEELESRKTPFTIKPPLKIRSSYPTPVIYLEKEEDGYRANGPFSIGSVVRVYVNEQAETDATPVKKPHWTKEVMLEHTGLQGEDADKAIEQESHLFGTNRPAFLRLTEQTMRGIVNFYIKYEFTPGDDTTKEIFKKLGTHVV